MRKREAEALASSKPVFLSKKQREELALTRRQVCPSAFLLPSLSLFWIECRRPRFGEFVWDVWCVPDRAVSSLRCVAARLPLQLKD